MPLLKPIEDRDPYAAAVLEAFDNLAEDDSRQRKCAACGKKSDVRNMKTCMDSRQMHRYVCDSKCMIAFYA